MIKLKFTEFTVHVLWSVQKFKNFQLLGVSATFISSGSEPAVLPRHHQRLESLPQTGADGRRSSTNTFSNHDPSDDPADDPSERSKMIETVWETNQPARCASNCDALVWSDGTCTSNSAKVNRQEANTETTL